MEYVKAKAIADGLMEKLAPHCEPGFCHIAGSIRRKKPDVGDVEIVCLAKKVASGQAALFETEETQLTYSVSPFFIRTVATLGTILQGSAIGNSMKIMLPEGIKLDLFMPNDFDYYRMLAIRTGSAEYSHQVIAIGWRKQGWVGTENGLRLQSQCIQVNRDDEQKKKWKCQWTHPTLPPVWKSEEEFFEWIKVPFVEPEKRYV